MMRRPAPLLQTLQDLRDGCSAAADTATIADLVIAAAQRQIGISGASLFRISGPVASEQDFVSLGARAPRLTPELAAELLQLVDRELVSFAEFFASGPPSFDVADRWSDDFLRTTRTWREFWHPWGVERQLVGKLGTAAAPRGYLCVARHAAEAPFTASDLQTFEALRAEVERALAVQHRASRGLEEALSALAATSEAASLLFDGSGELLWVTEAACARLSLRSARLGSSSVIARSPALEELRAWVRASGEREPPPPPPALAAPGEGITSRRYDDHGRARLLVTLGPAAARDAALSSSDARAEELARARGLTRRQTEVLARLATGQGNRAIAAGLGCSEKTVELHVSALLAKLGCRSRAELVARFWTH
jgi:DNA-binding NarL/FixJ family response regulator